MTSTRIVEEFLKAYYAGDSAAARALLADEFRYVGLVTFDDPDVFLKGSAHVAPTARGIETRKIFAEPDDVGIFYDLLLTHRVGRVPMAEWYHLENGKIAAIRTILDSGPFQNAQSGADDSAIDPVCGMSVAIADAEHVREHDGRTYFFCARGCAVAFERNPHEFIA